MLRILKTHITVSIREKTSMFWTLLFPLLLVTMYHFAFGGITESDMMKGLKAAVVQTEEETEEQKNFFQYLTAFDQKNLEVALMEKKEAEKALGDKRIDGIFFSGDSFSLTVQETGIASSILRQILDSYVKNQYIIEDIASQHPEKIQNALEAMTEYENGVKQVNMGMKNMDQVQSYFYAAIAMACMFGSFLSMYATVGVQANTSPLGARMASGCMKRWKGILASLLTGWILGFAEILILLLYIQTVLKDLDFQGVWGRILLICAAGTFASSSLGMATGTVGRFSENTKNGILVCVSLVLSFMADLMNTGVKYFIEQHVPFLNRVNPAALISDAFCSVLIYENGDRYRLCLLCLAAVGAVMLGAAVLSMRRMRYDSI